MDTSDQNQRRLLKWQTVLAGKTGMPISNSPSLPCETVVLAPGVMPSSVSPPAASTATPLGSQKNLSSTQTPCSIEITVELVQKLKSPPSSVKMSRSQSESQRGGTNTLEAGTVQEAKGKSVQCSARVLHTGSGSRCLKAAGQREAHGQRQGQTSLLNGGANGSLVSYRGAAVAYAKPTAS